MQPAKRSHADCAHAGLGRASRFSQYTSSGVWSLRDTRSLFRLKRIPLDSSLQIVHGIVLASRYVSAYLTLVENHSANTLFPQLAFTFHTGFDAMVFQQPSRSWLVNWQAFGPSNGT